MEYSRPQTEGGFTAPLAVVPVDATPGCEATDYGDVTGKIVLVQRGACSSPRSSSSPPPTRGRRRAHLQQRTRAAQRDPR